MKNFTDKVKEIKQKEIELEIEADRINDEIEIVGINDIFMDPNTPDITNEGGVIGVPTDFSNKEVKRGDVVYITALIRKKGQSLATPATQSVLKLRVVDIYNGLSYLNKVIN